MRDLSVHHIIPMSEAEEKCLDNDNLITLCSSCHREVEGNSSYTDLLRTLVTLPPGSKSKRGAFFVDRTAPLILQIFL